ncbi:SulP family inorganic anion transporter [Streptomyces sp. KR80]|uniref:SulP family inorganic anion transporter n=1 Tax=Streptomyces sp. KR80 TaxID=3457426 RepID=UPI003FD23FB8
MSTVRTPARHARKAAGPPPGPATFGTDFVASIVVFLVAVPLCIGVAAASGVPVALGIISGIVGGLVVGFLPGSSLQVSGPAAGLAALVLEAVTSHGLELLGPIVLAAGLVQVALGMLKMGRLFQSVSVSVVQGMLAGIGLPLIIGQTYAVTDSKQLGSTLKNLVGLPGLFGSVFSDPQKCIALGLGALSIALCFVWKKVPAPLGKVPAPLAAVLLGSIIASLPGVEVKRVVVGNLLEAVSIPGPSQYAGLLDPEVITVVITFAVIASAESLFSAAAVDRMHDGPRTKFNAELVSQGVGNTLCGFLGAMPMTAVIARSAANVQAGAKTKISRILHGAWLLSFGLLLPGLLGLIPVAVLAGILVHAGWKLFDPPAFPKMWRIDRGEGVVMVITTAAIMVANLLEGVLAGLAVAIVVAALRMSRMTIHTYTDGGDARLVIRGNATFVRLPRLMEALESVADKRRIHVDLTGMSHLDLACRSLVEEWADQRRKDGAEFVELRLPHAEPQEAPVESGSQQAPVAAEPAPTPAGATYNTAVGGSALGAEPHQARVDAGPPPAPVGTRYTAAADARFQGTDQATVQLAAPGAARMRRVRMQQGLGDPHRTGDAHRRGEAHRPADTHPRGRPTTPRSGHHTSGSADSWTPEDEQAAYASWERAWRPDWERTPRT